MTKAEQLVRRAEKAISIAEPSIAKALRFHIESLKNNPDNAEAQKLVRFYSAKAESHRRFFNNFLERKV